MAQGGTGPIDPEIRASDADRERMVEQLREHHAAGRLTLDEFEERMRKAYDSRTYGELKTLTRDLPIDLAQLNLQQAQQSTRQQRGFEVSGVNVTVPQIRFGADRPARRHNLPGALSSWFALSVLLTGIWLMSNLTGGNDWGDFWPIWPIGITGLLMVSHGVRGGGGRGRGPGRGHHYRGHDHHDHDRGRDRF